MFTTKQNVTMKNFFKIENDFELLGPMLFFIVLLKDVVNKKKFKELLKLEIF